MASVVDTYLLYRFVRDLSTPFRYTRLGKLGLINDDGEWIVPKEYRDDDRYKGYTYWDVLIHNLKLLIAKVPGGNSRIATFAAALYLLKEGEQHTKKVRLDERLTHYLPEAKILCEDEGGVPANNVGNGQIADPKAPMKKKALKRKKPYL